MSTDSSDTADSQDGTDTPTTEWFGQNVDSDTELAEQLVDECGEGKAEEIFDQTAKGEDVENARRGDSIDPDLGEAAYKESHPDHAADPDNE